MKALIHGRILMDNREVPDAALLFEKRIIGVLSNEKAMQVADEITDVNGMYVSPGFVDVHIHGYAGQDASDGNLKGLRKMAEALVANGVTSFLPTTMTVSWPDIEKALDTIRALMAESRRDSYKGALPLGCHAEGPFINAEKKGAQNAKYVLLPDPEKILTHKDVIRMVTYAPEQDKMYAFTRCIRENSDIVLSIGHTCATYDEALAAVAYGADHFTHTFNAMTPLNHRSPGAVGAALTSDAYTELIADTFHVHPSLFRLLAKAKGDKLVLITDCTRAGGLTDGEYTLGGQKIFVNGIRCLMEDGTIAGSVLKMNEAVRNLKIHACLPMWQAVRAATLNAAASIRMDDTKGCLRGGRDADIAVFDEDVNIKSVYIGGSLRYQA